MKDNSPKNFPQATSAESELSAGLGLWAVYISGPDDVYAAPTKAEAGRVADEINKTVPQECCVEATVVVWPYDALSHARELQKWGALVPNV